MHSSQERLASALEHARGITTEHTHDAFELRYRPAWAMASVVFGLVGFLSLLSYGLFGALSLATPNTPLFAWFMWFGLAVPFTVWFVRWAREAVRPTFLRLTGVALETERGRVPWSDIDRVELGGRNGATVLVLLPTEPGAPKKLATTVRLPNKVAAQALLEEMETRMAGWVRQPDESDAEELQRLDRLRSAEPLSEPR